MADPNIRIEKIYIGADYYITIYCKELLQSNVVVTFEETCVNVTSDVITTTIPVDSYDKLRSRYNTDRFKLEIVCKNCSLGNEISYKKTELTRPDPWAAGGEKLKALKDELSVLAKEPTNFVETIQNIYGDGDAKTKEVMWKSFEESGGTCLNMDPNRIKDEDGEWVKPKRDVKKKKENKKSFKCKDGKIIGPASD